MEIKIGWWSVFVRVKDATSGLFYIWKNQVNVSTYLSTHKLTFHEFLVTVKITIILMSVSHANSAMLVTLNINKVCQSKFFSHAGCVEYQSLSAMLTQLCWLCWILKSVSHADSAMLVLFLCWFCFYVGFVFMFFKVSQPCWFCFYASFVLFFFQVSALLTQLC